MILLDLIISTTATTTIEDFFSNDNPDEEYKPPPPHTLEQSPCYPIIKTKVEYGITWYYCKLHPHTEIPKFKDLKLLFLVKTHVVDIKSVYLETIEHHCKYYKPDIHKKAVLEALNELIEKYQRKT